MMKAFRTSSTLGAMLAEHVKGVRILDIGAAEYSGASAPPYAPLLSLPQSKVTGFDPEKGTLSRSGPEQAYTVLPHLVGDGQQHIFHLCAAPMTSSLLEPNAPWLRRFETLPELCRVVETETVETVRLDDLPALQGMQFLKIDVQGATLMVLEHAENLLQDVLFAHIEVEFTPIYKNAPFFGDVQRLMTAHGFEFHHFRDFGGFRDLDATGTHVVGNRVTRQMWADAVFVPDAERLARLPDAALLTLAVILHDCYDVQDFAHACLSHVDARNGSRLAEQYRSALAEGRLA